MKNHHPTTPTTRRGTIIIIAMVSLIFASAVLMTMVKSSLIHYRQTKNEQHRFQANWLAEAGLERAFVLLQKTKTYPGETWQIPAKDLAGQQAGTVTIKIEKQSIITVIATFPKTGTKKAVITRRITINK